MEFKTATAKGLDMTINTGDLELARMMLATSEFVDGHAGIEDSDIDGTLSEPGNVSITLNGSVVDELLVRYGWTIVPETTNGAAISRGRCFVAPDGDVYSSRDEALTVALTASVV